MNDEQLEAQLSEWAKSEISPAALSPADLASNVRALRAARLQRWRTLIVVSTVSCLMIGVFGAFIRLGKTHDSETVKQVKNEPVNQYEVNSDVQFAQRKSELTAEVDQMLFQVKVLHMNIRVQQEITRAKSLVREYDRVAGQEKQASLWLAATFQNMPDSQSPQ